MTEPSGPGGKALAPRCWIYRSSRNNELYLYLPEPDRFDRVPEPLRRLFGEPVLVMELTLDRDRRLARVDVAKVREALAGAGFFLQMPPLPEATAH